MYKTKPFFKIFIATFTVWGIGLSDVVEASIIPPQIKTTKQEFLFRTS